MCVSAQTVNCILTGGIVIFAYLSWLCAKEQKELYIKTLRTKHIEELRQIWEMFYKNLEYIQTIRAIYTITKEYPKERFELETKLRVHLSFTGCYFSIKIKEKETKFRNEILALLPDGNIDATSVRFDIKKFDNVVKEYNELTEEMVKE